MLFLTDLTHAGAAARTVKVALLSDPHLSASEKETTAQYHAHFMDAIAQVNATEVDLVLIPGDLANDGKTEEWNKFARAIEGLNAPVLFIPGNHDVGPKPNTGKESCVTSERYARYKQVFGEGFWVKEIAGLRVIGVTGSLFGAGIPEEEAQWSMLEKELSAPAPCPTLLLCHYPLFVESPDEPGGGYWNIEPGPRKRLEGFIRSGGISLVLSGHLHYPILHRIDGVVYAGAPAISFGLPRDKQPEGWGLITISQKGEIDVQWKYLENRLSSQPHNLPF